MSGVKIRVRVSHGAQAGFVVLAVAAMLAGCGSEGVDSGGLSAGDRKAARTALDGLSKTNISRQLVDITESLQNVPSACRVHLVSKEPHTFQVYVFWVPWLGSGSYTWLDMKVTEDPSQGTFHLGTAKPVLPGGRLSPDGRSIDPWSLDTTLLTRYGPAQARKNHEVLLAHGGNVFSKPTARCQVLTNGDLRLVPNP
jgi:hypothetical protein